MVAIFAPFNGPMLGALLAAVPALVAGVDPRRMAVIHPPPSRRTTAPPPVVAATCHLLGIENLYRIGGAQAVAALAYGSATVEPVDKIVGPGNELVAEAKRQVFGTVGIEMIPGPSEIMLVEAV